MEVKARYKQTEVGVIPEDWVTADLSSMSAFITKGSTPTTYGFAWEQSGIPFLRSECVAENGLDFSESMYISETAHTFMRRSEIKKGDLLVTITGYVGRVVLFNLSERANINQHIARVRINTPKVNNAFVYHYLSLPQCRRRFNSITTGQAYPQISLRQVRETKIPLPPTKAEQEAIAEALSDADALVESLEKLIAKKRDIKQGAMQELLTGKKRLPGFSGVWEVKRLTDLFDVLAGGDFDPSCSSNVQDERHSFPVYSNAVADAGLYGYCSYSVYSSGTITVTARGTLGVANFRNEPYTAIGRVLVLCPRVELDGRFYAEYINNRINFVVESTGVPQLTAPQISKHEVPYPSFSEQSSIAAILSDMDEEIALLEAKLAKARQIKQGMMQELLTGRIRLV